MFIYNDVSDGLQDCQNKCGLGYRTPRVKVQDTEGVSVQDTECVKVQDTEGEGTGHRGVKVQGTEGVSVQGTECVRVHEILWVHRG